MTGAKTSGDGAAPVVKELICTGAAYYSVKKNSAFAQMFILMCFLVEVFSIVMFFFKFLLTVKKNQYIYTNIKLSYLFKLLMWNIECLRLDTSVRQMVGISCQMSHVFTKFENNRYLPLCLS